MWAVLDYTRTKTIERELCLAKVSILGPEYFEDQLQHKVEQSRMTEAEHVAAEEHAAPHPTPSSPHQHLSPSEALRQKHHHLQALTTLTTQFQGKIVDVSHDCIIIEVSGKTSRIDAFLKLIRPYGILEAARTGMMVMPRAPIESPWAGMADEEVPEEVEAIDAVSTAFTQETLSSLWHCAGSPSAGLDPPAACVFLGYCCATNFKYRTPLCSCWPGNPRASLFARHRRAPTILGLGATR